LNLKKKANIKTNINCVNFIAKVSRNSQSNSPKKKDQPKLPRINTTKCIKSNFANLENETGKKLINSERALTKTSSQREAAPPSFLRKSKKSMSLIKAMDIKRRMSPSPRSFHDSKSIADVEKRIFETKKKNFRF
jgi:hypothetical protein